jgi:type II secretory pathway pseudopilin PulG
MELVMVIAVIGLIGACLAPQFAAMCRQARNAAETGTAAAVRSGISMAYIRGLACGREAYPAMLDSAEPDAAGIENPLFTNVVEGGVIDTNWVKLAPNLYQYKPSGGTYAYSPRTGRFTKH